MTDVILQIGDALQGPPGAVVSSVVRYDLAQGLTDPQKQLARDNIAAQASSATLAAIAALGLVAGSMIFATGANAVDIAASTAYGRALLNVNNRDDLVSGLALVPGNVGLGNVANAAQTLASVVPNTAPGAGRILVGTLAGTAYAPVAVSGDASLDASGALAVSKIAGVAPGAFYAGTDAANLSGFINNARLSAVPNAALANSSVTISGHVLALGGTLALARADISGLGTSAALDAGIANGAATLDGSGKLSPAQIPASLVGALQYQGVWNASANSPVLASGVGAKGQFYKVSVAGGTAIDGIAQWNIGDVIVFNGATWDKIDGVANEIVSVAGLTGAISAASLKVALAIAASDVAGLGYFATGTDAVNLTGFIDNARLSAVPNAALANSSVTISGHRLVLGGALALGYADISGLGSAAQANLTATNTQVAFNDAGTIAGSAQLTFDKTTGQLVIIPSSPGSSRGTVVLNANALAASALPPVAHHYAFRVVGPDNEWAASYIDNFGTISDGIGEFALRSVIDLRAMRGTAAVPVASLAGDEFSRVSCRGGTSAGFTGSVAAISAFAAENFTASNQGAWLGFRTTSNGTPGGGDLVTPGLAAAVTSGGAVLAGRGLFTSSLYACLINRDPGNGMFLAQAGYQVRGATDADYLTLLTAAGTGQPVIKLPFGSTDFTATGGAHKVVLQSALGGAFTVAQLTAGDISGLGTSAVLDAGVANGVASLDSSGKLSAAQIPASLVGALQYQGTWNANTNSPALASGVGTKGQYYKVSVAGATAIDGVAQWNVGDSLVFDGTTWDKIDGVANEVVSVAGLTGVISAAGLKTALAIAAGDVSGLAASATTDTTNAANIATGTLPNARLVSVPNTALANSSVTLSGHVLALGGTLVLAPADVSLGNVTNDTQAKAANYPNGAQGQLEVNVAVDFSLGNTDFALTIALPTGYARWRFVNSFLNHASASLAGGTFGVFSGAGGTGAAIVASATAATVAVTAENTQNNMQNVAPVNTATSTSYIYLTIYFRVQNVSSVAATCNFTLQYCPIS